MSLIAKLRELEKNATPKPWMANCLAGRFHVIVNREKIATSDDFELIDLMRNSLSDLLDVVEAADGVARKGEPTEPFEYPTNFEKKWNDLIAALAKLDGGGDE